MISQVQQEKLVTRGINEKLMPPPLIPLEALLELRRLLDSLQPAEAKCERLPQVEEIGSTEATTPLAAKDPARRRAARAQRSNDELQFFQ